jgi:deoxyribodipyrimidine photolyase-related protein
VQEKQMTFSRIIYVPFDHLNAKFGALKNAKPATDLVVLVESQRMLTGRPWHKERLFFLVSSARHFAQDLKSQGFQVEYIKAQTTISGLKEVKAKYGDLPIVCAEPSSFRQFRDLHEFGVTFVENDFFLTLRKHFELWAGKQKSFLMENFYRAQRQRLDILMVDGKPVGDRWNYDAENRLPPPKNYVWPPYLEHKRDEIDLEVAKELDHAPTTTWATTRKGALKQLDYFIKNHLAGFGPYEDAIAKENWALHHSLLSPYLNNGLLHASEVIEKAVDAFNEGKAPIESVEAFVRQIIGWREYINGMYWYLGEEYREQNQLNANRKLLPVFSDSSKTQMNCVGSIVKDIETRAWVHHIPRLMVLSNLALITGTNPQEFLDWMREQFIDAAEWVMVPNIIGMGVHADGGQMMTKPYAAGGAYISRMTEFCKPCKYDPKLRVGENACPFTTLYWDFLDRNREQFAKNFRMSQQIRGLDRLSDLPDLKVRAQEVLTGLEKGEI